MQALSHDGAGWDARAVRPAHTPFDGDTIFALASAGVGNEQKSTAARPQSGRIGSAAADCLLAHRPGPCIFS